MSFPTTQGKRTLLAVSEHGLLDLVLRSRHAKERFDQWAKDGMSGNQPPSPPPAVYLEPPEPVTTLSLADHRGPDGFETSARALGRRAFEDLVAYYRAGGTVPLREPYRPRCDYDAISEAEFQRQFRPQRAALEALRQANLAQKQRLTATVA